MSRNRYFRRLEKRKNKKKNFLKSLPTFEEVFTFEHLWESFFKCAKQVGWKPSIQLFKQNLAFELIKLLEDLYSEKGFQSKGFVEFKICERGKMRFIQSVEIRERIVQRCFCDYFLIPLLTQNLEYDNGASLEGKGTSFAIKRLIEHLKKYYDKYNSNEGYIVLYDFSNYFGNIDHNKLYDIVDPLLNDERFKKLYHHLVDMFGEVGLGLGSQVSQISAVAFPNKIDKRLAYNLTTESNARYMDDGYVICKTKEDAQKIVEILQKSANDLNIVLNKKKIKICKLDSTFIFLKRRFKLTENGQVIVRLHRKNVYKHLRRIKKLLLLVDRDLLILKDVELSHKTWYGQVKKGYCNKKSIYNVDVKIRRLFNDYNKAVT